MARRDELDQLLARLNISGLQTKNTPLYEVIVALIKRMKELSIAVSSSSGGGGGGSVTINNIHQMLDVFSSGGSGEDGPPGPPGDRGADGSNGMVPYYIAPDETFTVPEFKQALFNMVIDNEGFLDVDGFLIEVD